ncbi:cardiolipin synthase [Phaeobacter gallaeciensis]|uniref:cardiolipin synthase n=1 Tax=Phaeobacter gallaeciensis TaxID=60890 RepID=UPI0031591604
MTFWVAISTGGVLLMWGLAVLGALNAARTARTPQGAIGWVVFLLASPLIALPAYMIFGHHRFERYRAARQDAHRAVQDMQPMAEVRGAHSPANMAVDPAPFEAVSGLQVCTGNGFRLLIDGKAGFASMFRAIDEARDYLLIQFYIVRDDDLGRRLKRHIIAARQRGVAVWFMADRIGSHGLPTSYLAELQQAGVNLVDRGTQRGPKHRFMLNFRNHRKTVVADGRVGFTGGLNVGDEYISHTKAFGDWRDTHVELTGPVVQQLQLTYAQDWHWLTDEPILDLLTWEPEPSPENRSALIVPTGPGDTTENGSMMFFSAISAARSRVWIASPYFVPDLDVVAALKHAALRGVDVRILLPGIVDHYLPWLASFAYFDDLQKVGVQVLQYSGGFMHQKTFVVDDTVAAVGTTNMDNRSFRLNFETMALFFDTGAAEAVAAMLEDDFTRARSLDRPLAAQHWSVRLFAPVARLLAPVL